MKKIEAIIRPERLSAVQSALQRIDYSGIMVTEIEGHGNQKGKVQKWRDEEFKVELLPKIKIEAIVNDYQVDEFIKAVIKAAKTGEVGDGKIFVYNDVADVIRIRTGEKGEKALL